MSESPRLDPEDGPDLISTEKAFLDTIVTFLTAATHQVLFLRRIYPPVSFRLVSAYDCPVRQNRHPKVCGWINDAMAAIRDQMQKNVVARVAICIFECDRHRVLERWTFDLRSLPTFTEQDEEREDEEEDGRRGGANRSRHGTHGDSTADNDGLDDYDDQDPDDIDDSPELEYAIGLLDLHASLRANLARLGPIANRLQPLPKGPKAPNCSFTMTMEVKEHADRPVGRASVHERAWAVVEPPPFEDKSGSLAKKSKGKGKTTAQEDTNEGDVTAKTHPVRRLEAGELEMEIFVEESPFKFNFAQPQQQRPEDQASSDSIPPSTQEELEREASFPYENDLDPDEMDTYNLDQGREFQRPQGGSQSDYQRP